MGRRSGECGKEAHPPPVIHSSLISQTIGAGQQAVSDLTIRFLPMRRHSHLAEVGVDVRLLLLTRTDVCATLLEMTKGQERTWRPYASIDSVGSHLPRASACRRHRWKSPVSGTCGANVIKTPGCSSRPCQIAIRGYRPPKAP